MTVSQLRGSTEANTFLRSGSETARHFAAARELIPGGTSRLHYYFEPHPIYARSGAGCLLTDVEGVERLDFLNNMTALIHGHAHPAITRAIVAQAERGASFSEPADNEIDLARAIAARVPSVEQIRFANSGTEAVMLALKLARAYTGRSRIAKFEGVYHGYYDYVQVSFASTPQTWGADDAPASTPSSGGLASDVTNEVLSLPLNNRDAVEALLERYGPTLAAVILDPLSPRSAFPTLAPGFLDFLREITRSYGIPLIYDEVICFRVGYHGAQGVYGGDPDLTVFGKIIGGGLPIGAVGGRRELMGLLDPTNGPAPVISGGTFSGNPLTIAAGCASLAEWTPAEVERLNALGSRLRAGGNAVFAAAGVPGQLTGDGSLFQIVPTSEPISDYRSSYTDAAGLARLRDLHLGLLDAGVIVASRGLGCLSTPMGEREVDTFVATLERAVAASE